MPFGQRAGRRITGLYLALVILSLTILAAACGAADSGPSTVTPAAKATASASATGAETRATADTPTAIDTAPTVPTAALVTPTPVMALTQTPTRGVQLNAPTPPEATLTPSPTACTETEGQFTSVDVPSTILTYTINTRIYLPACYASSGQSYPVLYLVHGLNYTEDQWERLGIGLAADRLIAAGQIAPLIIVLPRDREDPNLDPAFVVDLVPYVDSHYRTLASAGYRAIGGMSRGGGWSIHLGLRYPNVFGRVGAHSPAIFYGDESNVLRYIRAVAKNGGAPAFYLDGGADDTQENSIAWLDQMLTAFRIPHFYVRPPGDHSETYWGAHLDDYLRFYAASWRPPGPPTATPIPSPTRRFQ